MPNYILKFIFLILFFHTNIFAQDCENADFSYGNFTYWNAFTGFCCGSSITTPGVVSGRHTIITQSVPDPQTNNMIMTMPPNGGGAYSVRLGNDGTGSEAEKLQKSFLVTPDNRLFIYQYAVVLQDPEGHTPQEKPKFEVKIYDQNNNIVNPYECGYYQVTAGVETDNWQQIGENRFKDWATVGLDLTAYIGTTVTVEFTTQDCGLGGHFGYAYIDASCGFLDIKIIGYCEGTSEVTLFAPEGFSSYLWPETGETTQSIVIPTPQIGDSIIVTVTNEAGCQTNILHVFNELPLPIADAGNDTSVCVGTMVNLWADGAGNQGQYTWYADGLVIANTQNIQITPLETKVYTVYVANQNGCYSSDSSATVTVTVNNDLLFSLPNDTTVCGFNNITIEAPSIANVNYTWTSSNNESFQDTSTITISPTYTSTYYLTISNSSCSYDDSVKVTIVDSEFYPDSLSSYYCPSNNNTDLFGPFNCQSYQWETGNIGDTLFIVNINPNNYDSIQLNFINQFGCMDSTTYYLISLEIPSPILETASDTICMLESAQIDISNIENCYYIWSSIPSGVSSNNTYLNVNPTTTTTYIVQAINYNGCSDSTSVDSLTIYVDSSAYFNIDTTASICFNSDTVLSVINPTGFFTWLYQGNVISNQSSITVSPIVDSYYYITQTVGNCDFSNSVFVTVNNSDFNILPFGTPIICSGDSINLSITPQNYNSIQWYETNSLIGLNSNITVNPTLTTSYNAIVLDQNNCIDSSEILIQVNPTPAFDLGNNLEICENTAVVLDSKLKDPNIIFNWSTSETTPSITAVNSGNYWLMASNNNCTSTDSVYITILGPSFMGEVPNVISADGDNINDKLEIDLFNLATFSMTILNRWGEKVFESIDPTEFWDGTKDGKKVPEGVYFYKIIYTLNCGDLTEKARDGNITVFK
ncbi:MAG: gliding motility-associated C-terminal domain-containing protein [Flavobacteriia bacterium]|nr:gliding motility-associated C-terminal domain-containing protein [Flavobacteriia bacterium]